MFYAVGKMDNDGIVVYDMSDYTYGIVSQYDIICNFDKYTKVLVGLEDFGEAYSTNGEAILWDRYFSKYGSSVYVKSDKFSSIIYRDRIEYFVNNIIYRLSVYLDNKKAVVVYSGTYKKVINLVPYSVNPIFLPCQGGILIVNIAYSEPIFLDNELLSPVYGEVCGINRFNRRIMSIKGCVPLK